MIRALALACGAAALFAAPVRACSLSLILAFDTSSSVDEEEYALQMKGMAAALIDPEVIDAILGSGGVQVMAFEWSGRDRQRVAAPWTMLDSDLAVAEFASRIESHPRTFRQSPTAIGSSLGFAWGQFRQAPRPCDRKVIDVAGDGVHNESYTPDMAYREFPFADIVVNGLVIEGDQPDPVPYYRQYVLHGPGAFLEVAAGFGDYARAMKRKLLREIRPAIASR